MKKIIPIILCVVLMLSFGLTVVGCRSMFEHSSGDFLYKKFGERKDVFAEIMGLSEQGRTKKVIVIPKTIDGLPVDSVRQRFFFGDAGTIDKFASDELEKLYFLRDMDTSGGTSFRNCKNLKQIFVLEMRMDALKILMHFLHLSAAPKVYIFKGYYDDLPLHETVKEYVLVSNVTYYYNYTEAPNRGCYWLDNIEVGERIEFLPQEPTRGNGRSYTFGGWYLDKECTNKFDVTKDTMPTTGELNLYAKWIEK